MHGTVVFPVAAWPGIWLWPCPLNCSSAAGVICKAIASSLEGSSPTAAENAAAAAAALCAVLPAGSHGLVTELVQKLQRGMASQ